MATRARLFVSPDRLGPSVVLRGAEHHYLASVLRLRPGAQVTLLDGQGRQALAVVSAVHAQTIELSAEPPTHVSVAQPTLVLFVGLLKGDKQDFVIQKATELGASRIIPVQCDRSVPQLLGERSAAKHRRWQDIAKGAAQQSKRADVPDIAQVQTLEVALREAEGQKLLFYEGCAPPLAQVLDPGAAPKVVSLLIGPEGGLADSEIEAAKAVGFSSVSLGPLVLRAETAVVAALAVVGYLLSQGADDAKSC